MGSHFEDEVGSFLKPQLSQFGPCRNSCGSVAPSTAVPSCSSMESVWGGESSVMDLSLSDFASDVSSLPDDTLDLNGPEDDEAWFAQLEQDHPDEATHLILQIANGLKECGHNLAKHRDFRLARTEARMESGDIDLFEVGHPILLNASYPGNYMFRGYYAGRHDAMRMNGNFSMSTGDLAGKIKTCGLNSSAFEVCHHIPVIIPAMHSRFLNPSYVAHRCHRAARFLKNSSYTDIMSRLAVMWERRRCRIYSRRDPPTNTPWAPSISISEHYLSDNKKYEVFPFGNTAVDSLKAHIKLAVK